MRTLFSLRKGLLLGCMAVLFGFVAISFAQTKVTGTTFGTPPWATGSEYNKAFDNNTNTFFDAKDGSTGYTGIDLGASGAKVITQIKFYPRSGSAARMAGGKFQGSNTSNSSGYTDLYTISGTPGTSWTTVSVTNSTAWRYLRYYGPANGFCNVAEVEFYTTANQAPTDITLSPTSIPENNADGATVGTLTSTDPTIGDSWIYTFVTGTGSDDNGSFAISSNLLKVKSGVILNYEVKNSYTVRIRTTDNSGLYYEKQITITVTNVNEAPTDISLSSASVAENLPANTLVGTFSATDPDASSTFTFSLASGAGSTDNGSFTVSGNQLKTAQAFDFETKNSYCIRMRVTDNGNPGLTYEKQFTISVIDVSEYINPVPTPTSGSELTGPTVTISWTPITGAYGYKLQIGNQSGGSDIYNGVAGTATSAAVSGLPVDGRTMYVRITTTDVGGPHTYDYTYKAATDRPRALNVQVSAADILRFGQTLHGQYTYQDQHPEGATSFKWYRADDPNGTNRATITGATSQTYVLIDNDVDKYIQFEVTPRAQSGVIDGLPTTGAYVGPIMYDDGLTYVYPKVCGPGQNIKVDGNVRAGGALTAKVIKALELVITPRWQMTTPPDYVFGPGYNLSPLKEVEEYVTRNRHLQDVPSATTIMEEGVNVVDLNMALLKKVEELTLYTIQLNRKMEGLQDSMTVMKSKISGVNNHQQKKDH